MDGVGADIRLAGPSELTRSASAKLSVSCVAWIYMSGLLG